MKRTYAEDYIFGTKSEEETLSAIQSIDSTLKQSKKRYSKFDYVNDSNTIFVELKTRTNAKDKYPTTMFSNSKIKVAEEGIAEGKSYYFVFKFTDGLFYIQYNKELFATFEVKNCGRFDRGRPELNDYCLIPIDKLTALPVNGSV